MDKLFSTKEAADFLHVSIRTFKYWTSANKIAPVQRGLRGAKFYSLVQLESLGVQNRPVQNCTSELHRSFARVKGSIMTDTEFQQHLENLPDELLSQARFFAVNADKTPKIKGWSNPDNQKLYYEIEGLVGFDTCGHDIADDYLLIDCDHIFNDAGEPVNENVATWLNYFKTIETYQEISISERGGHILLKPTTGKFDAISAGRRGTLDLGDGAKIELFYKSGGRYCLMTGNMGGQCPSKTTIVSGEAADEVFEQLLRKINKNIHAEDMPARTSSKDFTELGSDYDQFRAELMLKAINPTVLTDSDWLAVMSACKNIDVPYPVVDAFNRRDGDRYDERENQARWDSLNDPSFDIRTLHGIAKRFNYDEKNARRQWFQIHPEQPTQINSDARADSRDLQVELQKVNKEIADFNTRRDNALETLRNLQAFDRTTVLSPEIKRAVAFAYVFDTHAFTDFKGDIQRYGKSHPDTKLTLPDLNAAIKDLAKELKTQFNDLLTRRTKIQAQIKSLAFIDDNDTLTRIHFPPDYSISSDGIYKVDGDKSILVCRRPVIISGKSFSVDEKIYKLTLSFLTVGGKWKKLQPIEKAILSNKNKIVDLANTDLSVTTSNARALVDYLDDFHALNENTLPLTYFVNRCGWHSFNGENYFVDPRRPCLIQDGGRNINIKVDKERSDFAKHLKQSGSLEKWKEIYTLAKKSPVARFIVAAAVAAPLLKILGERNFLLYIHAPTRAGKTTALYLAASAIGSEKIIRSFDATKNGLAGAAADVNDYAFLVDEKQVADNRLKETFDNLVYALANGIGRTKLNRDSSLKKLQDWRTIAIMTGETEMLPDNATGGAYTRLLSIKAPKVILSAEDCKTIHDTIKDNRGLVLPLVVDKILELGKDTLRDVSKSILETFTAKYPAVLPEYRRYVTVLTIADALLNSATFGNTFTTEDGKTIAAIDDATLCAKQIFKLIPTIEETDDTSREKAFVLDFIAQNQPCFIGGTKEPKNMQAIYGKLDANDGFIYLIARALKDACDRAGFNCRKLADDLIADGFFIPADKVEKGRKSPLATVQKQIEKAYTRCYRIPKKAFEAEE